MSWWILGGYDVTGAAKAIRSLTTGFGWEIAAEPVEFVGDPDDAMNERLLELGGTIERCSERIERRDVCRGMRQG